MMDASDALANEKTVTPPIINSIPNIISATLIFVGDISPYPTVVMVVIT